jgi:tRNA nucleotidyltransferase (CCA-adding enzyme)
MTYELKEHDADMGVVGIGDTVEQAFEEGARAMFSIMIDLDAVETTDNAEFSCDAESIEMLFVEFLNNAIAEADIHSMVFSKFEVVIKNEGEHYSLTAKAYGEKLDQEKHKAKTEVKAATLHGMKYEQKEGKHYVQCVVDV